MTDREGNRSPTRRGLVEDDLLERSAALFASRGINGTTLKDIADAVGMSRSSLYHYVDGKETLLRRMVDGYDATIQTLLEDLAANPDAAPQERLRALVEGEVGIAMEWPSRLKLLDGNAGDLPADLARVWTRARQAIYDAYLDIIVDGIETGSFRSVDTTVAVQVLMGMCSWVAWWVPPAQAASDPHVAYALGSQAVRAVTRRVASPRTSGASPAELVARANAYARVVDESLARLPR